jgi:glycosyltransferase involved in cell wall biosynthesis
MTAEAPLVRPLRIVHIVPRDFRSVGDGGRVKTAGIASALAALGELHIVDMDRRPYAGMGFLRGEVLPLPFGGEARFHSSVDWPPADGGWLACTLWKLRRLFTRRSRAHRRVCATRIVQSLAADVVVADDITGCLVARDSGAKLRVTHTHNVESVLHEALYARTRHRKWATKARQYREWERSVLPALDQVWAVSEADAGVYRQLGVADVRVMYFAFPDERFEPAPVTGKPGVALYFGVLSYPPNSEAAVWLAQQMPAIRAAMPDAVIRIAGGGASEALKAQLAVPGIEVLGFVKDLRETARDAAVIVVPVNWGGGTKTKTGEAMALGKPILSTPEGVRGLPVSDGEDVLVHALESDFTTQLLAMLQAPQDFALLGLRAQTTAQRHFSLAALRQGIATAIADARKAAPA